MPADETSAKSDGVPPDPIGAEGQTVGTVLRWFGNKGHGVIASAATSPWDIWCHFSAIDAEGVRDLAVGEQVDVAYYRTDQLSFRYRATRVRRRPQKPES